MAIRCPPLDGAGTTVHCNGTTVHCNGTTVHCNFNKDANNDKNGTANENYIKIKTKSKDSFIVIIGRKSYVIP